MSANEYIVVDPDICNGKPTVKGTRITVQTVLEYLALGESQDIILKNFPRLTHASIQACIQFAADMAGHEYSMHRIVRAG
jgi:uncharacterized protein (DUF433 family)